MTNTMAPKDLWQVLMSNSLLGVVRVTYPMTNTMAPKDLWQVLMSNSLLGCSWGDLPYDEHDGS